MLGILAKNGYQINLDEEKADIILINTCAFIKDAEKESVKTIVELAEAGKKNCNYRVSCPKIQKRTCGTYP